MNFFSAQFLQAYGTGSQLPNSTLPELVMCGRSNVGKSSLINKLCNRKSLARVSSTPGKTTTINFFALGGDSILVDLPGYGYAKRSDAEKRRWAELMESYFSGGRNIGLALLLLDCRRTPNADDLSMLDLLQDSGMPFAVVLTKSDKLSAKALSESVKAHEDVLRDTGCLGLFPFTVNGQASVEALRNEIVRLFRL